MSSDRREAPRHQVRKNGKILFMDRPLFVDCIIRNISESGALLSLLVPVALPQEILLWEEKTGRFYECAVRWRRDHIVGVHFTKVGVRAIPSARLDRRFGPLDRVRQPAPTAH